MFTNADFQTIMVLKQDGLFINKDFAEYYTKYEHLDVTYKVISNNISFCIAKKSIYFCGHSLGPMPKNAENFTLNELKKWANLGVKAHFDPEKPWVEYHAHTKKFLANLTGAEQNEVVAMGSLTANIHLLLAHFYKPTEKKYKILIDSPIFSSDYHAVASWVQKLGFNPQNAILEWKPNADGLLETDTFARLLNQEHSSIALLWLSGVNYLTGQALPMHILAREAQKYHLLIGLDLAHAIGNIPLSLHHWGIDFAAWCSYKYLNSGPGGVAGIFVHHRHLVDTPTLRGWWGHAPDSRFAMEKHFVAADGIDAWQLSNAPILNLAVHEAALQIFEKAGGINKIFEKSKALTSYLYEGLLIIKKTFPHLPLTLVTPELPEQRGSMVCISTPFAHEIFGYFEEKNIVIDFRSPQTLRITPAPLYNTFKEVALFIQHFYKWASANE